MAMTREQATTLALEALAFLAANTDKMQGFLAASGLDAETLRARAGEPALLAGVLGFLLCADETVLEFCEMREIDPRRLHLARAVLEETG